MNVWHTVFAHYISVISIQQIYIMPRSVPGSGYYTVLKKTNMVPSVMELTLGEPQIKVSKRAHYQREVHARKGVRMVEQVPLTGLGPGQFWGMERTWWVGSYSRLEGQQNL